MQKNFQQSDFTELDNISLTAIRILIIFDMLLNAPCDDKEINEALNKTINDGRELSKDTICIYLNTLRLLGCVISRPSKNNNFKYILISHPFKLTLEDKEVETLIELRKNVSVISNWKTAVEVDNFCNTITKHLNPSTKRLFQSTKKTFLSRETTSENFFRNIKQLEKYCQQNKTLTLLYNSPESGEKDITLTTEKITMENNTFYLWGYNEELETTMYLRIDRIQSIKTVSLQSNKSNTEFIKAKYKLKLSDTYFDPVSEDDEVLEKNDKEMLIQTTVSNKFRFFQKILSYGNDCTIIEPDELKEEMLNNLANMLKVYEDIGVVANDKQA